MGLDVLEGVPEYGPAGMLDILSDEGSYAVTHYLKVTEEFLELLGGTCFLVAFLRHLAASAPNLRFRRILYIWSNIKSSRPAPIHFDTYEVVT